MRINCTACGSDMNPDHEVFKDYNGPVKCFCCSTMMDIKTTQGIVDSINPLNIVRESPIKAVH